MSARLLTLAAAAALLAACKGGGETEANQTAAANTAAPAVKHPTYCFFKDAATKGWSATRDAQGAVTVKGKAHVEDTRYTAQLEQAEVSGTAASLWLTMGPNTGPTGAEENWWDVKATVPASAAVETVTIMCGKKTVAELKVPAAR